MTIQFKKKIDAPIVSNKMLKVVSEYRRQQIEGSQNNSFDKDGSHISPAGYVIAGGGLKKRADLTTSNSSLSSNWRGSGGSVNQHPELYSPLWMTSNLNFPRDRATINAWSRAFFAIWGIVQNPIFLHSTYPISKLSIKCKGNPRVEQFFAEQIEELDLMNVCCQIAQEYWLLGEAYPYAEFDESTGKWARIILQNPDYITVRRSLAGTDLNISLRPDSELKRICLGGSPEDARQRQQLNPAIVEYVKRGEDIPLDEINISQIARKIAPYEVRGTGLVVSCFKPLMLLDKINEAHVAQASNMINPLTLVKIGGNPDYKPLPADLEMWRDVFLSAQNNPDFKIFTHEAVTVDRIGYNSGILDTSNMEDRLLKFIYIGLMVPQVLMDGGSDTTYSNGTVALDVLKQRYMTFRNMLSAWLRKKIFAPIAKANKFYEKKDGKNVLIVPEIDWNHMFLFDTTEYIQQLKEMVAGEKPLASKQTLYRSLGLDYEDERRKIKQEMIEDAIAAKEEEVLQTMQLSELRALNPNDEIQEPPDMLVPGQENNQEEEGSGLPGIPSPESSGLGNESSPPPPPSSPESGTTPTP